MFYTATGEGKDGRGSIAGIEIGGGASVTTSATSGQDYDHLIRSRGERMLSAIHG